MKLLKYIWAFPNTVLGLFFIPLAIATGGRVQIIDGVLEVHGRLISGFLTYCVPGRGRVSAITLGHVILGHDGRSLSADRVHEHEHVRQYEVLGPLFIPVYIAASIWSLTGGREAYAGNFLERKAFKAQNGIRKDQGPA
ncbi:MAG TPA: hypothetical protein PK573_06730 [Spirochaetota bacterium]|nr:hypothetical protein [Spirochaetota bacterium]